MRFLAFSAGPPVIVRVGWRVHNPGRESGASGARPRGFPHDVTAKPAFKETKLDALWDFWTQRRGTRAFPDRADFDPVELRAWLGHLMMVERVDTRWIYRLYGTYFVETFRREMTGKGIDELPAEQAKVLQAEYDGVRASGAPAVRTYSALFEFGTPDGRQSWQLDQTWERVSLPLSDAAAGFPDEVRVVLVAAYLVGGRAA